MKEEQLKLGFVFTHKESYEDFICMMHEHDNDGIITYSIHIYDDYLPYGTWYGNIIKFTNNGFVIDYNYLGKSFEHKVLYKDLTYKLKKGKKIIGMNDVFLTKELTTCTVKNYV